MASVVTCGMINANALSVPGATAATMEANVKRLSARPGGRCPRVHQTGAGASRLSEARLVLEEQADALVLRRTLNSSQEPRGSF